MFIHTALVLMTATMLGTCPAYLAKDHRTKRVRPKPTEVDLSYISETDDGWEKIKTMRRSREVCRDVEYMAFSKRSERFNREANEKWIKDRDAFENLVPYRWVCPCGKSVE